MVSKCTRALIDFKRNYCIDFRASFVQSRQKLNIKVMKVKVYIRGNLSELLLWSYKMFLRMSKKIVKLFSQ